MSERKTKGSEHNKLLLQIKICPPAMNASCLERSSSASFFALVKTLWETCLRLEDIDLSEVLAGPAEGSPLLEGMGWSEIHPEKGASHTGGKKRTGPNRIWKSGSEFPSSGLLGEHIDCNTCLSHSSWDLHCVQRNNST